MDDDRGRSMGGPRVRFVLPNGGTVDGHPDAVVGRSSAAGIRVDDPRVSTVHAELSWRADGFVLIARGGRLRVGSRAAATVPLTPGLVVELAPHVALTVVEVVGGEAPVVPPTAGRDRLRWWVGSHQTRLYVGSGDVPFQTWVGIPGRITAALALARGRPLPWDEVAIQTWPGDAAIRAGPDWTDIDERRFRNRWDQQWVQLRRQLEGLRSGQLLAIQHGVVTLAMEPYDTVELADPQER